MSDRFIEPEWADEAFADDDALAGLAGPGVEVGGADRLVGCSPGVHMVIVVTCLPDGLTGVNAWKASPDPGRGGTGRAGDKPTE